MPVAFPRRNRCCRPFGLFGVLWAGMVASGCADKSNPTGPASEESGPVEVTVSTSRSEMFPGDAAVFRVAVDVDARQTLSELRVQFTGLLDTLVQLSVPVAGDFANVLTIQTRNGPFEGEIRATATARMGQTIDSASAAVRVLDDGPPRVIVGFNAEPYPGDTMDAGYIANDAAGIKTISYRVWGAVTVTGGANYQYPREVATHFRQFIPRTTRLGDSLTIEVTVTDGFDKVTIHALRLRIRDYKIPSLGFTVTPAPQDSMLAGFGPFVRVTGQTLDIQLTARDDYPLKWIGYRGEHFSLKDSVVVSDSVVLHTFSIPVTAWMEGEFRSIIVFTRDSTGNERIQSVPAAFVDGIIRRYDRIRLPFESGTYGAAYRDSRELAFVGRLGRMYMLTLDPFNVVDSLVTGTQGLALDLAPGRDSVWMVTSNNNPVIWLWDFSQTPFRSESFAIAQPYSHGQWGFAVGPDNRAIVSGYSGFGVPAPIVQFVDLATRTSSVRTQAGFPLRVTRSEDGSLLLGYDRDSGRLMVYRPGTDTFGPALNAPPYAPPSVSRDGSRILVHNYLYDGSLNLIREFGAPEYRERVSVISPDGQFAYFAIWPGIHKVRISDGSLVEKVFVPFLTQFMFEVASKEKFLLVHQSAILLDMSSAGVFVQ